MRAMALYQTTSLEDDPEPLRLAEMTDPSPAGNEVVIHVSACGVCHTELDEIEGRTPPSKFPIVPGHQVVGTIARCGVHAERFRTGDRVGVAWIFHACGACKFCLAGKENLCASFRGTGRDADGGYAEFMSVHQDFCYPIPGEFSDAEAAPLLCAGAIGYRSLRLSNVGSGKTLGLTGFGASAHLVLKMARHRFPDVPVFVFARSAAERAFALDLGAAWAGDTADTPPGKLDAIIDTTPVWTPVVEALRHLDAGGRLVINAIRKEETDKKAILRLSYPTHLWMEKEIKSVANVTRRDVSEFLQLAADMRIRPEVEEFPLKEANRALAELKAGRIRGAKVLRI